MQSSKLVNLIKPKFRRINPLFRHGFGTTATEQVVATDPNVFMHTESVILPITNSLEVVNTQNMPKWPVFRILDPSGTVSNKDLDPNFSKEESLKMYQIMTRIRCLDDVFYNAQRQGRISFYMQSAGEEAIHIGCAAALSPKDVILAQYREVGLLLWRGFSLQQCADQCFSNESDLGKGRQMPVHYGSRELNYQTISSPLATQLPQAAGVGYALKLSNSDAISICFFGEGAASEGDFHAAMNFASTLEVPMIFFCRNNGFAISTPTIDQYRGDGIASRAVGYGMHCIRVDGNDIMAVYAATKAARQIAVEKCRPVLIEAMTYRRGHHSTSDDSTRYRSLSEIKMWQDNFDPLERFRIYLEKKGWWTSDFEQTVRDSERFDVLNALETAEKKPKPSIHTLFEDVYSTKPAHLIQQEQELHEHVAKYPDHYSSGAH